jgi:hypothetical protein
MKPLLVAVHQGGVHELGDPVLQSPQPLGAGPDGLKPCVLDRLETLARQRAQTAMVGRIEQSLLDALHEVDQLALYSCATAVERVEDLNPKSGEALCVGGLEVAVQGPSCVS